ncbi:MAG TPA: TolC family protein, partial [Mariniphaga sp.]|nr:TolC family protein [Mariniphaga sp.]
MKRILTIIIIQLLVQSVLRAQVPEAYLKMAAENNPALKASYLNFEAALKKIPQVNSLPDPTMMFGYTIWPTEPMQGMEKAVISLNQMFPWFGTLKASGNRAALQAEASYQNFIDQRNNLFLQVASAWYPLYELHEMREIEKQNISILNTYKNIATRNFESGNAPMVDVLRVDLSIAEAETRLSVLDDKEQALLAVFNNLLNRAVDAPVEIPETLNAYQQMNHLNKDSFLFVNPQIKQIDYQIEASALGRKIAEKQSLPNIGLGLEYMFMGNQPGMDTGNHKKGA